MSKPKNYKTFRLTDKEERILEEYCDRAGRTYTDVLRELVRSLDNAPKERKVKQKKGDREYEVQIDACYEILVTASSEQDVRTKLKEKKELDSPIVSSDLGCDLDVDLQAIRKEGGNEYTAIVTVSLKTQIIADKSSVEEKVSAIEIEVPQWWKPISSSHKISEA